ncbi:hypothetical protein CDIK_3704 [Cucumispora dikerogammari]|nr:hypothetical protein CDIK_3704 [Cucumispora dikerogammari]
MLNLSGRVRNNEVLGFVQTQCDLPERLRKNHREEVFVRFVFYDERGSQENRVVVFFSEFQKRFLLKGTAWTIDGAFKSVPSHFYQLVTVHAESFVKFFSLCSFY